MRFWTFPFRLVYTLQQLHLFPRARHSSLYEWCALYANHRACNWSHCVEDGSTESTDKWLRCKWRREWDMVLFSSWSTSFTKSQKEIAKIEGVGVSVRAVLDRFQLHIFGKSWSLKLPVKRRRLEAFMKDLHAWSTFDNRKDLSILQRAIRLYLQRNFDFAWYISSCGQLCPCSSVETSKFHLKSSSWYI